MAFLSLNIRRLVLVALLANATNAQAINTEATGYRLVNGTTVTINPSHSSPSKDVTNSSGADQFISTKTATEWANFLANPPAGISIVNTGGGGTAPAGVAFDTAASGVITSTGTTVSTSAGISTTYNNELLIASVGCYLSAARCTGTIQTVTGGGLTWVKIGDYGGGTTYDFALFRAWAATPISNQVITATMSASETSTRLITVSSYSGTDATGTSGSGAIGVSKSSGCDSCPFGTTNTSAMPSSRPGSLITTHTFSESYSTTIAAATGSTVYAQQTGTYSTLGVIGKTATTPAAATSVSTTWTTSTSANMLYWGLEILAPITAVTSPTLDQIYTADNAAGAGSITMFGSTAEGNELLLLAVTWKNNTAMSTTASAVPLTVGGGTSVWVSIGAISQGTGLTTEVFRAFATNKGNSLQFATYIPGSAKATIVLAAFRGVNTTGTSGSGAIDAFTTGTATTANPSISVTPATANSLVIGFLGSGNATAPTAGTGFTRQATISSSGGGAATTKATTTLETKNALSPSGTAVPVPFTNTAIDWAGLAISLKP